MQKRAIVTGGSRGIGKAIVEAFCQAGYQVAFCYKSSEKEAKEIALEYTNAFAFKADIESPDQVQEFVSKAVSAIGGVDVLVNNAGISHFGLLTDIEVEQWDRVFSVNTRATFLTSREVLPQMIRQKSGSIINIASMWGETGGSCEVAYSASKGAVIAMTKALAKEVGPSNITVNCISPGMIETEMNSRLSTAEKADVINETALLKLGTPQDIAEAVLFLATAKFITGQIISVNGGILI